MASLYLIMLIVSMKNLMRLAISSLDYSNRVGIVVISKWELGNYPGNITLYLPA